MIYAKEKGRWKESLKKIEKLCVGNKILDVGADYGYLTNFLMKKGYDVTGIDINRSVIKEAKKRYGIKIKFQDVRNLSPREKYDTIVILGILEYLDEDPSEMLTRLGKNLNKGGRIIFSVSNIHSIKQRLKCLLGLEPIEDFYTRNYQFTKKRIIRVIKKTLFNIIKLTTLKVVRIKNFQLPMPDLLAEDFLVVINRKSQELD